MIVDASLVSKWYLPDETSESARSLIVAKDALFAPSLLKLEVLNALSKAKRMSRIPAEHAEESANDLRCACENEMLTLIETSPLVESAFTLSLKFSHPVQDCIYIIAAQIQNLGLATFDKKQAEIAKSLNLSVTFFE